jgi:hypothetical protein
MAVVFSPTSPAAVSSSWTARNSSQSRERSSRTMTARTPNVHDQI